MTVESESSNYRPGEPLRSWGSVEPVTSIDLELILKASGARESVMKLVDEVPLSLEDELAFGRLNSWCVQMWYEPMVMLIKRPQLDSSVKALLQRR